MKARINIFFLFWISIVCLPADIIAQQSGSELIQKIIVNKQCVGVAAGFSVVGETHWMDCAGLSDLKGNRAFDSLTVTRIASIAKPMTAIAIMQLFERGKLELDTPIQAYLPDFPIKKEGDITIRHLLQHASGIDGYKNNKEQENKIQYETLTDVVSLFKDRPLLFSPGQSFYYTTYGYVLLGLIIEKVSGLEYEMYMKRNIWEKAGMMQTSVDHFNHPVTHQSKLYHRNSKGEIEEQEPTNLSDRIPGGGILSTLSDMLKFGEAILNNTLIRASTFSMMTEDPKLKTDGNSYGFGWFLYGKNPSYGDVYGHNGTQTGASTFLMLLPDQKTTIVVLSNTSGAINEVFDTTIKLFDMASASRNE